MQQEIITIYDYILLPFYLILFYLVVRRKAKKYNGTPLKKFLLLSFWLHMFGAILLAMLMQYYYGYGDSFGYYTGGDILREMISKDISAVQYFFVSGIEMKAAADALGYSERVPITMIGDANAFIMKTSTILSYFSFNCFLIISLFFGLFSFLGSWKLFYVMQKLNAGKHINLLGYSTIVTPSLWFWGSGVLKEPICIAGIGIGAYILYKMFILKQFSFSNLLLLIVFIYSIAIVKSYVIIIIVVSAILVFLLKIFNQIGNKIVRAGTLLLVIIILAFTLINDETSKRLDSLVFSSYSQIELFKNNYEALQDFEDGSKAGFTLGAIQPTLGSLIANSPVVIASCLFRPFLWESKKVIILFTALESFIVLLATLFILLKTKFFGFFYYCFSNSVLLYSFIFSMLFALVIGYTTFNFGAMVRYKILFLPFYFFLLIGIYTRLNERSVKEPQLEIDKQ